MIPPRWLEALADSEGDAGLLAEAALGRAPYVLLSTTEVVYAAAALTRLERLLGILGPPPCPRDWRPLDEARPGSWSGGRLGDRDLCSPSGGTGMYGED